MHKLKYLWVWVTPNTEGGIEIEARVAVSKDTFLVMSSLVEKGHVSIVINSENLEILYVTGSLVIA